MQNGSAFESILHLVADAPDCRDSSVDLVGVNVSAHPGGRTHIPFKHGIPEQIAQRIDRVHHRIRNQIVVQKQIARPEIHPPDPRPVLETDQIGSGQPCRLIELPQTEIVGRLGVAPVRILPHAALPFGHVHERDVEAFRVVDGFLVIAVFFQKIDKIGGLLVEVVDAGLRPVQIPVDVGGERLPAQPEFLCRGDELFRGVAPAQTAEPGGAAIRKGDRIGSGAFHALLKSAQQFCPLVIAVGSEKFCPAFKLVIERPALCARIRLDIFICDFFDTLLILRRDLLGILDEGREIIAILRLFHPEPAVAAHRPDHVGDPVAVQKCQSVIIESVETAIAGGTKSDAHVETRKLVAAGNPADVHGDRPKQIFRRMPVFQKAHHAEAVVIAIGFALFRMKHRLNDKVARPDLQIVKRKSQTIAAADRKRFFPEFFPVEVDQAQVHGAFPAENFELRPDRGPEVDRAVRV